MNDLDALRAIASDESTSAETLIELSAHQDGSVRRRVAMNLNTPIQALHDLAKNETDFITLCALAHRVESDYRIDSQLVSIAIGNRHYPSRQLENFATHEASSVRKVVASRGQIDDLWILAKDEDSTVRELVAINPYAPTKMIDILAEDEVKDVRRAATKSRRISHKSLVKLAKEFPQEIFETKLAMADDPDGPSSQTLREFAKDKDVRIRTAVALNGMTSSASLNQLSKDAEKDVRIAVASNPMAWPATLDRLANDGNEEVRRAVASHSKTPAETLKELAKDGSAMVRDAASGNLSSMSDR